MAEPLRIALAGLGTVGAGVIRLIETNAAASVRDEPGCHRFDVATDPAHPDEVFLYEIYDDAAAFDAHRQTPHYAVFDEAISDLVAGKEVRTFARVFP